MIGAARSERGVSLVETLIAVAIVATALVVFLGGLSTGSITTASSDRMATAADADNGGPGVQLVTVEVSHGGVVIFSLQGLKVDR
jgi:hypothetical protein